MEIRFVAQPFEDGTDLRDFLHAVAEDAELTTLRIIVAWAKRSGLGRAAVDLQAIRGRGGKILTIAGISEGGATEQGLRTLIDLSDEAYVFHDIGRTFHPKVYLASGPSQALLLVGSHNLTAGGIAWNYEAGIWCNLNLSLKTDKHVLIDVVSYFDKLRADTDICVPLELTSLSKMLADKSLLIQDEGVRRRPQASDTDTPEESDSPSTVADIPAQPLFGRSQFKKRATPGLIGPRPATRPPRKPTPIAGSVPGSLSTEPAIKRWFKQMDGTAAQHPPGPNSNPTGNLRLSQEDFSIDHTTYFLNVFFGGLTWTPTAKKATEYEVWIPMEIEVASDYLGDTNLRISHDPNRISGQGNVPTVLHWGVLSPRLRQNNYIDMYVNLERISNDKFRLVISNDPRGPFLY